MSSLHQPIFWTDWLANKNAGKNNVHRSGFRVKRYWPRTRKAGKINGHRQERQTWKADWGKFPVEDFSTGKLPSPKAMTTFPLSMSPGEKCFSLSLTSVLSSVAKIRKRLMATDKKGRRGRQT